MVKNGNASARDVSKCVCSSGSAAGFAGSATSASVPDADAVRRVKLGFRSADGTKLGNMLARRLAASRSETYRSTFIDKLGVGAYAKAIPNPRTPFDWLSTDEAVVDDFIADELCGAMFTLGGYAALTDLVGEVATPASAAQVPKDLPLLFVSGSEDPVGECGKAPRRAAERYRQAGVKTVDCIIYEGMRHEIPNEIGRAKVYEDIASWISEHTGSGK